MGDHCNTTDGVLYAIIDEEFFADDQVEFDDNMSEEEIVRV